MTPPYEVLAAALADGDLELPSFTDEELAAFAPAVEPEQRLVPLPHVDSLAGEDRVNALSRGLRSLLDRGYLSTATDPEHEAELLGEFGGVMAIRLSPAYVVIADRIDGQAQRSRYLYGLGSSVLLEEEPDDVGVHRFMLRSAGTAATALVEFVDLTGCETRDSVLTRDQHELDAALAKATAVTRLFAVRRRDEHELDEWEASVAVGPAGVWVVAGDDDGVAGRELSRTSLELLLHRLLEPLAL